ncbi:MAG: tetratricopeptide repeat protein [Methanothrix sp.]|nr:MAG: tetratricopeptide repeat protein [Methanothrix sp.]
MDQLVVLQEIYESFSKGGEGLQKIDVKKIAGSSPDQVAKLLDGSKKGRVDEDVCEKLSGSLTDAYEIKRLGDICRKAGLHLLAIKSYNRALALSRDPILRPVLLNNLGQAYARQGDLARSLIYYQKAASGFESAGDQGGMAHVLGNLGSAYRRQRDWENAIEYCYRSLKTFQETGDSLGVAQMTGSLGRVYAEMGERELAARYFEKSLVDFQKLGDKKSAAWVLDRMGKIAGEKKDYDHALGYYNQSLSIFQEQGHSHSAGVVLSDLGRMYLGMGETAAAGEALERAVRLIPRGMQPSYQNALSGLAAAYSATAKSYLAEAEDCNQKNDAAELVARANASKYFAQSSDKFLELASSLKEEMPAIKAAAGIARSRSYLAKISSKTPDDEAMALSERALSALDLAGANSDEQTGAKIESLKRTLSGLKETRSIGLLGSEPWRLAKAVSNACEYLLGGAAAPGEANGHICDALHNISASIDAESGRKDPAEKLKATAADLRRAESRFSAGERDLDKQSAARINCAAKIIEGFVNDGNEGGQAQSSAQPRDRLSFKPERDALLLISGILADNAFLEIDNTEKIYTWDDSLHLVVELPESSPSYHRENIGSLEPTDAGAPDRLPSEAQQGQLDSNGSKSVINGPTINGSNAQTASPTNESASNAVFRPTGQDMPVMQGHEERLAAQRMVLADSNAGSKIFVSEAEDPEEAWLVPVKASMACSSRGQILLIQDDPLTRKEPAHKPVEIIEPVAQEHGVHEPLQEIPDLNSVPEPKSDSAPSSSPSPSSSPRSSPSSPSSPGEVSISSEDAPVEDLLSGLRQSTANSPSSENGLFSQENAVKLVKGLGAVVFMLLAIEVVLHLI